MIRGMRAVLVVGACAFAALVAAGCGGDDADETGSDQEGTAQAASGGGAEGTGPAPLEWVDVPSVAASLRGPDGELVEWCLLLAATVEDRTRGLMDAPDEELGGYDGMAFTWDETTSGMFHMRDTEVPLSIAFFDGDGAFVSARDMDPCPPGPERCPVYGATAPYRYAVEVPMGDLAEIGIGPDWTMELGSACTPP